MSRSVRNYIIVGFLLCCWIPFILITDLFPFMRMGMFAEPIKEDFQTERFEVWVYTQGQAQRYNPTLYGTDPSVLYYLARNYYYRQQSELFLQKLNTRKHYPKADSVLLYRFPNSQHQEKDSSTFVSKLTLSPAR